MTEQLQRVTVSRETFQHRQRRRDCPDLSGIEPIESATEFDRAGAADPVK